MVFICLDTETTGLELETHCLWQVSGIIYDGNIEEKFDFKMKPFRGEPISSGAFIKTGMTQEMLDSLPDQKEAFNQFNALIQRHLYKEDGTHEKAFLVGYNIRFDVDFLCQWFEHNGYHHLFRSYFNYPYLDVMTLAMFYLIAERPYMKNFKLTTVYEKVFGYEFEDAHNGMADSIATWKLFTKISEVLMKNRFEVEHPEIKTRKVKTID